MIVQRAYRYRFYPTEEQAEQLARSFGCARWIYNWGLQQRTDAFYQHGRRLYYKDLAGQLKVLKQAPDTAWLAEVSSVILQQALRHLDAAFARFFKKQAGYPAYKSRRGDQSCSYMRNGFTFRDGRLTLAKQREPLDIRWSRPLPKDAAPSSVTVTRTTGGKYYVSFLIEANVQPLPATTQETGIDLNVKELVLSTGRRFQPPKALKRLEQRKRRYQRACRRKVAAAKTALGLDPQAPLPKGTRLPISNNLHNAHKKVGRIMERQANVRRDWQHKTTTTIVRENQVIAMEDLYVRGLTAGAKGTAEQPGKRVRRKAGLNRAILDVGFGEIRRQIDYKAQWYGRTMVLIDRWYPSSQRCCRCGHLHRALRLSDRHWTCSACGTRHDRDLNAARNILAAGQAILQGADALRVHE
ncbi:RNA-guided endonuclease InsQ/TnpB family protein [Allochromatium tepidum]|uniref:Transposase n=1 Tax=Allochromatium tepidum TaxID=553982 RepID=A0ABN6GEP3_9GAMM|nr:RNA-guided endonuclease TnpB family protein [Allochromatium tepidum]BCU08385.1 transposase [Allochromatium tepidum]